MGQLLIYSTTTREGYHTYKSNLAYCRTCPLRTQCTQNQKAERLITRHIYQATMDNANAVRLSEQGKKLYKRRAETV
ncbi:transposase, partial [Ursidibacter sp. B-7004-1]